MNKNNIHPIPELEGIDPEGLVPSKPPFSLSPSREAGSNNSAHAVDDHTETPGQMDLGPPVKNKTLGSC